MDAIWNLTSTTAGKLEMRMAQQEVTNEDVLTLAACSLDTHPGEKNWVEEAGGLPEYICRIARSISTKRGKSISNAIQIAVGVVKRWAKGVGDVDADTRAKAAAAVAQWEAIKAKAHAKSAVKTSHSESPLEDLQVKLASSVVIPIPPYVRVKDGQTQHVDAHTRHVTYADVKDDLSKGGGIQHRSLNEPKPGSPEAKGAKGSKLGANKPSSKQGDMGGESSFGASSTVDQLTSEMKSAKFRATRRLGIGSTNKVWGGETEDNIELAIKAENGMRDSKGAHEEIARELAAQAINDFLGVTYIPRIELRTDVEGFLQVGDIADAEADDEQALKTSSWFQLSQFVPSEPVSGMGDPLRTEWEQVAIEDLRGIALFDAIIGNPDRHGGNVQITKEGRAVAMDHGRAFGPVTMPISAIPKGTERDAGGSIVQFTYDPTTVTEHLTAHAPEQLSLSDDELGKLQRLVGEKEAITQVMTERGWMQQDEVDEMFGRIEHMVSERRMLRAEEFESRPWADEDVDFAAQGEQGKEAAQAAAAGKEFRESTGGKTGAVDSALGPRQRALAIKGGASDARTPSGSVVPAKRKPATLDARQKALEVKGGVSDQPKPAVVPPKPKKKGIASSKDAPKNTRPGGYASKTSFEESRQKTLEAKGGASDSQGPAATVSRTLAAGDGARSYEAAMAASTTAGQADTTDRKAASVLHDEALLANQMVLDALREGKVSLTPQQKKDLLANIKDHEGFLKALARGGETSAADKTMVRTKKFTQKMKAKVGLSAEPESFTLAIDDLRRKLYGEDA